MTRKDESCLPVVSRVTVPCKLDGHQYLEVGGEKNWTHRVRKGMERCSRESSLVDIGQRPAQTRMADTQKEIIRR